LKKAGGKQVMANNPQIKVTSLNLMEIHTNFISVKSGPTILFFLFKKVTESIKNRVEQGIRIIFRAHP